MTHEFTHVIRRRLTGDLNDSTPEIFRQQRREQRDHEQDSQVQSYEGAWTYEQSGIMSENKLFGGRVDFVKTVCAQKEKGTFNLKFFEQALQDLTTNTKRVPRNDSFVYVPPNKFSAMALDIPKFKRRIYE